MTTLAALVAATPAPTRGVPTGFTYGAGVWRHVVEVADPSTGSAVVWYDLTAVTAASGRKVFTGYEYNRGSDGYMGRYRASVATLDLVADDDRLAPWNPDTSPTFGTHVPLGPGLLLRSGFIRVDAGVVVEWNPRWTLKVEQWLDSSYSRGKNRQHRVVARDLFTSFVGISLPAFSEENWSDRMFNWLTESGWHYGSLIYGAQFEADTTTPILTLPDRPESDDAINELDATLDPVGLVWYTNRKGQLVVRPRVDDTFHADAFAAGATGDEYPGPVPPVSFGWFACELADGGEPSDFAAYAIDTQGVEPFGLDKTERWVVNHLKIATPAGTFDDDDPISQQRYDPHSVKTSWIARNDTIAAQILASRAYADTEARPLRCDLGMPGFHPGPAGADFMDYVAIVHRNADDALTAFANGWLRVYRERVRPVRCDTAWDLTLVVDVYAVTADASMLPVEGLHVTTVTDTSAEFAWTNPAQTITPTNTQVRLLPSSLWGTIDYPGDSTADSLGWGGLSPSTNYEFQVRLVRIEDGLVTAFSPLRSVAFKTAPTVDGHLDVDPDGGATVDIPPPDDPVLCIIGWEAQWSADGATWTTFDSGTITTPPYVLDYDLSTENPLYFYRFRWREICNLIPGDWHYTNVSPITCVEPARLDDEPYDDAHLKAYWPRICPDGITEALSEQPMTLGPALHGAGFDPTGIPVLISGAEGLVGYQVLSGAPAGSSDLSIAWRGYITTQPTSERIVHEFGGMWLSITAHGSGFRVHGNCREAGAGITTISNATDFLLSTIYDLTLTHDTGTGDLILYVNAVEQASALGTVGNRSSFGQFAAHLPANSWGTDYAVWDRVLDPSELPGYVAPPTVTINQGASQLDPGSGTTVVFDVVFSEAVTGFATGDVTLSGTATGTLVGTVSGSGATYTVTVTGMAGAGTVIADIAAAVCTSVATGVGNAASTSTDNTVTWASAPAGVAGYAAGGQPNVTTVNKFAFPSDTRTTLATGLSSARWGAGGFANPAVAGYAAGGDLGGGGSPVTTVDKFAFPSDTQSTLGAGLVAARWSPAGFANPAVAGYAAGGFDGGASVATVYKFAFPSDTRHTLGTGLSSGRYGAAGFANPAVAGYVAGGNTGARVATVDKFAFPSDTRSTLGTGLSSNRDWVGGFADPAVAGYAPGGGAPTTTVDKFTFPSDTRSTLATGLSSGRQNMAGFANPAVAGYAAGGDPGPTTNVDKFAFPSDTRSTLATGLSVARTAPAGFAQVV